MLRRMGDRNLLAIAVGAIRCASGISFLVAPDAADRLWGGEPDDSPKAALLLRSMGYRDALVGGMLLRAGLRGDPTAAGWFLASGGADLADLVGGLANHERMTDRAKRIGLGGAVVGIGVGLAGAAAARRSRWRAS
jgi:hypothetical protein